MIPYTARRRSLSFLITLSLLGAAPTALSRAHTQDDLAPLVASLASYFEAEASTVDVERARADVEACLAQLEETRGADPLANTAELSGVLRRARKFDGKRARRGMVASEEYDIDGARASSMEFTYRVPKDYDPDSTDYPLVLAIPDADESAAEHIRDHWNTRELRDGAILVAPEMTGDPDEWDRVSVDGRAGGLCRVLTALRYASETFAIDANRIYVAGRGKGIAAALATGNYAPQLFAGVICRAGDASEIGVRNFGNLASLFTENGGRAPGKNAADFQVAAQTAGFDNCLIDENDETQLWEWMTTHSRVTFPTHVTVATGDPFPTRAYWLRVAPSKPDAMAAGRIDREANSITLSTDGVSRVTLFLNDELLDLDRPITVECDGSTHELRAQRRLPTTLELLRDGTSDAQAVYVARVAIDTTAEGAAVTEANSPLDNSEFVTALASFDGDAAKLWTLYETCTAEAEVEAARITLRHILRLAPNDVRARNALGFVGAEGLWFDDPLALERHQLGQQEENAKAKGHVQSKLGWIHRDERALANKGMQKDFATGQWLTSRDVRRVDDGWSRQDLEWIEPEEAANVDNGLWRIDGEWVEESEANVRRSRIDSMWTIPRPEVVLHSTADRGVSLWAAREMGRAIQDLRRVFGAEPVLPLDVAMLRDEEQYDRFAFGAPDGRRRATHAGRLQVVHHAFFAESWFALEDGKRAYRGMGVCYWDTLAPYGDLYGVHAARLAVGLSYVDALDPSPKAVRKALAKGPNAAYYDSFLAEKKLPAWLRYGAAVYAERYFHDTSVVAGDSRDPWWARAWSLDNLRERGGMRPLDAVFAFEVDPSDRDDGQKLLLEAGLLVAFVVDGECAPVTAAHDAFKQAMIAGRLHATDLEALLDAIRANESALAAFAG